MKAEFDVLDAQVEKLIASDQTKSATITSRAALIESLQAQLASAIAAGSDLPVAAITDLTAKVTAALPPTP